ncbi:GNAT family N-acetyltransferase [Evansella sp. AB-rgal1]|uniref:GNAT family N-acetyltransferase n=1 Tax=Evansella sp. AB-rgal1 TaxID=3242696 RepID=UPI00359CCA56
MEWHKDIYKVSDDRSSIDVNKVSYLLSDTYWVASRSKESIEVSIENSITFGLYKEGRQIGFARVVTDKAVFSWLLDVVIDERYRGKGLGKWLIGCILEHPDIKHTSVALATKDAHSFYEEFQFHKTECMRRNRT